MTAIVIDLTGPDWEPNAQEKYYAQRGAGKYAFGATEQEALQALLEAESKEQSK
jgi:hypothetical protein